MTRRLTSARSIPAHGWLIPVRKALKRFRDSIARKFKLALALALAVVLITLNLPANSSAQGALDSLFRTDLASADVVILLDASQSMTGHQYGYARRAVIDFALTLTNKDSLHLRTFGDTVSNPLEGRGDEVAALAEQYLPREPVFSHTDIGLAILKGIEFLERDSASKLQAFFLITDGLHQPPQDIPFSRDLAADPDWQELMRRAHALCDRQTVFVYGFGIGRQNGVSILRRVFPAKFVEVMTGDAAQLAPVLNRVRERMSRAQLRRSIEQEMAQGMVEVRLPSPSIAGDDSGFDLPVTIRNSYERLPVWVERIDLERGPYSSEEISCVIEGDRENALLEPGRQWDGRMRCVLREQAPRLRIGEIEQVFQATYRIAPLVRFDDEASLDQLGVRSIQPVTSSFSLAVELRSSRGISHLSLTGLVLAAGFVSAIVISRVKRVKRKRAEARKRQAERGCLAGKVKVWPAGQREPEGCASDLGEYRAAKLYLVIVDARGLEVAAESAMRGEMAAQLSGRLLDASPDDGESGKPEFFIEAAGDHSLAYESGGRMIEASRLVLCDEDLIEIDRRWRLRYVNHRLRTRAEVESAQI
jgi:hypothetical protein